MAEDYDSMWEDDSVEWDGKPKKSARMPTLQELNAQIVRLERENFQLKLRVHLNETKGTVEPITAAAPRKSQRELQMEQESQVLRVEKEQLELKVQQLQSQLRHEMELKEESVAKEASLQNKLSEIKKYVQLLEREKGLNRLRYGPAGSPYKDTLDSILSPIVSKTSTAVNTEPLHPAPHSISNDLVDSYENMGLKVLESEQALESMRRQFEVLSQERMHLVQQLNSSEEARKREAMFMGKRTKEALDTLTIENRSLKHQCEELHEKVQMLEAKSAALKKAANVELTSQLIYHQTALEKVHHEQALLIEELQKLKKSCPLHKLPVTELCKKGQLIDIEGDTDAKHAMDRCKPGESSHFITSPRSLNHSGQNSLCLLDWEAQPDPTHALQPDKPSDGNNNNHEEQITGLNKKLHEKNSKLAIKLQRTRESLKRAIAMLEHSEKDKEGMEKIICRQLHRTHLILSDVKETLTKSRDESARSTPRTFSDLRVSNDKS